MGVTRTATLGTVASSVTYAGVPKTIPNLEYWFNADEPSTLTLNGSKVVAWNDLSSSAFVAQQGNDAERSVLTPNALKSGRNAIVNASGQYMSIGSGSGNTKPFSLFVACKFSTDALYRSSIGSQNNGMQFRITNTHRQSLVKVNTVEIAVSTNALTPNTNYILGVTYSSIGVWAFFNNNVANGTGTNDQTFSAINGQAWAFVGPAGEHWIGSVGEIVKYARDITATERDTLYTYLSGRWL